MVERSDETQPPRSPPIRLDGAPPKDYWVHLLRPPEEQWEPALANAARLILPSRMPMMIWWGPELMQIYNSELALLLGDKHPHAFGASARETWAEVWDALAPLVAGVMKDGHSTFSENLLLLMKRHGYVEETYWNFSFSPILVNDLTCGVLVAAVDVTAQVVSNRRLETVRQLGGLSAATTRDVERTCAAAARVLAANRSAVPFAIMYLVDHEAGRGSLVASYGVAEGTEVSAAVFELSGETALARVVRFGRREILSGLGTRDGLPAFESSPLGPAVPDSAMLLPISVGLRVRAVAVLGINPYRHVDEVYLTLFELVERQLQVALTDAAAYDEERRRAAALGELDQDKTRFYENVSHEFRTPLTLLLGPLDAVLGDPTVELPPVHRDGLETVQRSALRLRKLVESLLDFSRMQSNEAHLHPEPTDIAALTEDLASMFRSLVEAAGLTYSVDVTECTEIVDIDREMWARVVLNLLSNAVKFTLCGSIRVHLDCADDNVVLRVEDTGVGIPPEYLHRVFERFAQLPAQSGRSAEGSGIGLALVAAFASAHGGTVDVSSEIGVGSTFRVSIPSRPGGSANDPRDLEPTAGHIVAAYATETESWLRQREDPRPGDSSVNGIAKLGQILLVEDNADMRIYLTSLFTAEGWRVDAVGDVESALQNGRVPDVVVSDVMLPGRSGLDLVRLMRADETLRRVPVIVLTARSGPEAAAGALELGADDYVVKPFDAVELLARVRVHFELAKLRDYDLRRSEEKAANLGRALASNRRIGVAVGVLMTREQITAEAAFDRLRVSSQHTNRKLYDVADEVALTGELPPGAG